MAAEPPKAIVEREGYSVADAEGRTIALESLLRRHGLGIRRGSALESIALSVFNALYQRDGGMLPGTDVRQETKHLIGMAELAGLVLSVQHHSEFPRLLPLLRLLNEGTAIQNMPSSGADQATNKVFELFAAIFALHCGINLEIDDDSAPGRNPDVLITIGGRRWGIACKCLHGDNPEGFIGHFEKAIDQIEKSPAEVGVVLFSIKNLLDQSRYWRVTNPEEVAEGGEEMLSAFQDPQAPFLMLVQDAQQIGTRMRTYLPPGYLERAVWGKKALPGLLVWAHAVTAITVGAGPIRTSARVMTWQHIHPTSPPDMAVLACLHDAAYAGDHVVAPAP